MRAACHWGFVSVVLLVTTRVSAAPDRSGFTGDLGIGLAWTSAPVTSVTTTISLSGEERSTEASREGRFGLAPLSLSLGGFLDTNVAVLFRAAGTSYFEGNTQWVNAFYGPIVEVWPSDRFYLSGGFGFGVFGPNPLASETSVDPEAGFALDFRAGAALVSGRNHDVTLSLEAIPGFYENETVHGYAFVGAWKWY